MGKDPSAKAAEFHLQTGSAFREAAPGRGSLCQAPKSRLTARPPGQWAPTRLHLHN